MAHQILWVVIVATLALCGESSLSGSAEAEVATPLIVMPFEPYGVSPWYSGPDESTFQAIRSPQDWAKFWSVIEPRTPHEAGQQAPNAPPKIDFGSYTLIVAAIGTRPRSGYAVAFTSAADTGGHIQIQVEERVVSGAECTFLTAITHPMVLGLIHATDKPVQFDRRTREVGCGKRAI